MPRITRIATQKRRPNRRNIHLDGRFAFACHLNVVARFRLREGMELTLDQIDSIRHGEVRQECMDYAMRILGHRQHCRAELARKLARRGCGDQIAHGVLDDLVRLDYINDDRFARTWVLAAAQHRHHGPRRALADLLRRGVDRDVAERAIHDVYDRDEGLSAARALASRHAPRLRRLDSGVARRRLVGLLQRRGFEHDQIAFIVDEITGPQPQHQD